MLVSRVTLSGSEAAIIVVVGVIVLMLFYLILCHIFHR